MGDVITRFKLETAQYDSKLRDATDRMKELMRSVQVAGGSLNDLSAKDKELARSFGTLSTGANNAKDKVRELTNDFNKMARQYNAMTKEMQESDTGKIIAEQMQVMKNRLTEAKKELYDMGGAMGSAVGSGESFDSVLHAIGGQLGINSNLMGLITTGTLGYAAAITAGITATVEATKAWSDYNLELEKQSQIVLTTTGLKGDDAEKLQDGIKALAKVYDVDFRDAVNAANTLIQQFGVSGEEALNLLKDGLQGMIAGDGGKLLSMIQQYAPSFRDAGIEASQLVAIIQNSEGGLFTDQNMNAIVMGIRNIRHQTKATQDALEMLGIDGKKMSQQLNEGTMTVFEALQQVAGAIDKIGSGSDAAGAIMQNVFGRQGTMAGTKLGEAIATLNTNLEETKKQTGLVGESMANLANQNEKLNQALRGTFGYDGWQSMANGIESALVGSLADAITMANDLRTAFFDVTNIDVFSNIISGAANAIGPLGSVLDYMRKIAGIGQLGKDKNALNGNIGGGVAGVVNGKNVLPEVVVTPEVTPTTTTTTTSSTTAKKEKWAPIDMKSVDMSKFGILPPDTEKQLDAVIAKVKELNGVMLDPHTMEVTVDDVAALAALREIDGVTIDPKTFSITVTDEALPKLRDIEGVSIDEKTFSITATDEALPLLKDIDGVKLDDKELKVIISVDDSALNQTIENIRNTHVDFLFGRSKNDVKADISKWQKREDEAGDEMGRAAAKAMVEKYQEELKRMNAEGDVTKGGFADAYKYDFGKDIKGLENAKEKKNGNESKQEANLSKEIGQMAGGMQSMAAGLETLGVELPEGLDKMFGGIMSVVQVLQGISAIVTAIQVISAADTFIPFARGGIVKAANGYTVPGNFGYDAVPSLLTSGEVVLNRAQQGNIVSQMMDSRMNGGAASTPSYVRGEDIWLGVNNFLKRSGRGEIVTSRK